MPLNPIPANAVKVEILYDNAGLEAVNVLWFEADAGYDQTKLDDLTADVAAAWVANIMPLLYSTAVLVEVRGTYYVAGLAAIFSSTLVIGGAGGVVADDPAPPNVAVVLSWRTAVGGRQNRGRTYLPGIPNNVIEDNGRLTEAARADFQTAAQDFITAMAADTDQAFSVFSRPTYDPPRAGTSDPTPPRTGHFTPITTALVDARVDTQRGRLD